MRYSTRCGSTVPADRYKGEIMQIIQILICVAMFVSVLLAIKKGYNTIPVLLLVGSLVIFVYGGFTGISSAAVSTGSVWLDAFQVFQEQMVSFFAGNGIIIVFVLGYVAYMNHLKATDLFAYYISKPLRKLKQPYIAGALVILLAYIFVTALPSGVAIVALLFGVVYPIMKAIGLSDGASASAITIGCATYLSPGNPGTALVSSLYHDGEISAIQLFTAGIPYMAVYLLTAMAVYVFANKLFDKKDGNSEEGKGVKEFTLDGIDAPKWYAVLPLFPILLVILFSGVLFKGITIDCMTAVFVSFCFAFTVELLRSRNGKKTFGDTMMFFKGMGDSFGVACMIAVAGMVFSTALTTVGGIQILANWLAAIERMPVLLLIVVFIAVFALLFYVTGTFAISYFTILPMIYQTVTAAGRTDLVLPVMLCALICGSAIGQAVTPISAATLFISGAVGIKPTEVSRRNALPCIAAGLAAMAVILIFSV